MLGDLGTWGLGESIISLSPYFPTSLFPYLPNYRSKFPLPRITERVTNLDEMKQLSYK